jgi:RNA polymerase sigma-70 factor, ECF subfamily
MTKMQLGGSPQSSSEIPEDIVIQRILAGETDLYGILAARYNRRIYFFARRMVKNDLDAEDIVQEAHLRALTYLHGFRGGCKFVTWLSQVAANVAYSQLRRRQQLEKLFNDLGSGFGKGQPIFISTIADPERCACDSEAREILRRALAELPRRYQLIFLMKEVRHMTTPEIARRLGIRQSNVRLQLHRAKRMLQSIIDHSCQ